MPKVLQMAAKKTLRRSPPGGSKASRKKADTAIDRLEGDRMVES